MNDFFGALELELRAAAERRPRRPLGVGQALGAVAAIALVAAAVLVVVAVSGGGESARLAGGPQPEPVGTVIPKRPGMHGARTVVVANGVAPVTGPWQLEVNRSKGLKLPNTGEVLEPPGYCLWFHPLDPPDVAGSGRSGFCGAPRSLGFRKTPGFSRAQAMTTSRPPAKEVMVYGRVPDRAAKIIITAPGARPIEVEPADGPKTFPGRFYAIPMKPGLPGARINWLDAEGQPGSRGIRLMPPITGQRRR
jgi:hypothetical protein